jgi:hypothetical protein
MTTLNAIDHKNTPLQKDFELAGAMRLSKWAKALGVSRSTIYRWRKTGKLKIVRRYGIAFVTVDENRRFWADSLPSA